MTTGYEARCFEHDPFDVCCANCNDGSSKFACAWKFSETHPPFEMGGNFSMGFNSKNCGKACEAFNNVANTRFDYCEGGKVEQAARACPAAKRSLNGSRPPVLCAQQAHSQVQCDWHFVRGETPQSPCGNHMTENISGSFEYPIGAAGLPCEQACAALGNKSNPPADFCPEGRVMGIVHKCQQAFHSLESSGVPSWWCTSDASFAAEILDMSFAADIVQDAEEPTSASIVVTADSESSVVSMVGMDPVCEQAYRDGCWNQGSFQRCCASCNEGEGNSTCQWSFKGPPTYEGDTCISEGEQVNGSFVYGSFDCFLACSTLSHNIRLRNDLCPGSTLRATIDKCPQAQRVVETAVASTNPAWCNKSSALLDLGQVAAASPTQCQVAYEKRCFEKPPFSHCCATCSDGSNQFTCNWDFKEYYPKFNMSGHFVADASTSGLARLASKACEAFDTPSNTRLAYCQGGRVEQAAQSCPAAKRSIDDVVPHTLCKREAHSHVQCDWWYERKTNNKDFFDLNWTLTGTFEYHVGHEFMHCLILNPAT